MQYLYPKHRFRLLLSETSKRRCPTIIWSFQMTDKLEGEERNIKGSSYTYKFGYLQKSKTLAFTFLIHSKSSKSNFIFCIIKCFRIDHVWDDTISGQIQQKLTATTVQTSKKKTEKCVRILNQFARIFIPVFSCIFVILFFSTGLIQTYLNK